MSGTGVVHASGIAAQVSLYPLRQMSLSPAIDESLRTFQKYGLDIEPGAMSTVLTGDDDAVFAALHEAFRLAAAQGHVVMNVTFSNACPVRAEGQKAIDCEPVGYVENEFDAPVAADRLRGAESKIVLSPDLTEGLEGLEPGQQLMVVFYFHRALGYELLQHPQGDTSRAKQGVFALRSPRRPNRIGVSIVDLVEIESNVLRVRGLDAINGTPVLDLKPA